MRDMQSLLSYFNSPNFQQSWTYGDRSAGSLGLDPEEYSYLQQSGFKPFQPNTESNYQNFGGQFVNAVASAPLNPLTGGVGGAAPAPISAPTSFSAPSDYSKSIQQTLPGGTSSTVGGANALGSQPPPPPNPWKDQPKPPGTVGSWDNPPPAGAPGTGTSNTPGGSPSGITPGFDVRKGSNDPAINHQVYGENYFPSGDPRFQSILAETMGWGNEARPPIDQAAFLRMDENSQGLYRTALERWFREGKQVPSPGGGGGTAPPPGSAPPGLPGASGFGNYPFPKNFTGSPFDYNQVQDYTKNPAYQSRLQESERALNRAGLARGRFNSTGQVNALGTNARRLGAEFEGQAYERARSENALAYDRGAAENMSQYDRALTVNKLLHDRDYQANVLNYERKFRENERQYGRAKAEEMLAYERLWNEDAREYDRVRYLIEVGLKAGGAAA